MPGRPTNEPNNYFAFGFQSGKDSEASTFQFLRHLDGTGFEIEETTEGVREGGDGQFVGLHLKTAVRANGQAVLYSRPEVSARLAAAVLGADTTAAALSQSPGQNNASPLVHDHIATPTSSIPYLTIEQRYGDIVERATNVKCTGLTVEWEAGRPIKLTPEFVCGGTVYRRNVASALTPTREARAPFRYPGASIVTDGTGEANCTKGSIKISRGVDVDIQTTGLAPADAVEQTADVQVAMTLKYEDATLYDKVHFAGGTQVPVHLATGALELHTLLPDEAGSVAAGAGATTARFEWWKVNLLRYTGARVNKLDPDGKTMYIDVTAEGNREGGATHVVEHRGRVASIAAFF